MILPVTRHLLDWPRGRKRALALLVDAGLLSLAALAAQVATTGSLGSLAAEGLGTALLLALPVPLALGWRLGLYRVVTRFITLASVPLLAAVAAVGAVSFFAAATALGLALLWTLPVIMTAFGAILLALARFGLRSHVTRLGARERQNVVIYGTGEAARQLYGALAQGHEYSPVALIAETPGLEHALIAGAQVYPEEALPALAQRYRLSAVLLAVPGARAAERRALLRRLLPLHLRILTVPGLSDLVSGRARINDMRDVALEELLGREPVAPDPTLMGANCSGKTVLVTGAGGSIGRELCRQVLGQAPRRLILLDLSEAALFEVDRLLRNLRPEAAAPEIVPVLGSITDAALLDALFARYAVDTVYHAAAYKHVPLLQENCLTGVANNVLGTVTLARASVAAGVRSFILVSSDKAVRPTSVMGASKRIAELVCQALDTAPACTAFSIVRFGNVLGSSGSVIPLFRQQIAAGGPVTVTDPAVTRYFMTVAEAAELVIQAGALGQGGEIFVLEMGEPIRILDLAARMISLSGFRPVLAKGEGNLPPGSIEIRLTGLRSGEKLFEEPLTGATIRRTRHSRILVATEAAPDWAQLRPPLDELTRACEQRDPQLLLRAMKLLVPEFQPAAGPLEERLPAVTSEPLGLVGRGPVRGLKLVSGAP